MLIRFYPVLFIVVSCLSFNLNAGQPAPDFILPTLTTSSPDAEYNNSQISLKDLKGHVVYLDFWATWCPPCRKSFPWMDEMSSRYKKDGLIIVAVNVDKKRDLVEKFIKEMKPHFPIAFDPAGDIPRKFKVRGMPTSYLIDRKGNIVSTHLGFRNSDKSKQETKIKSLLAQ